jgi:PhzF family phenazine biosynthesis protein
MNKQKIYQVDAFTNTPFSGNPAGVTFGNFLSEGQKQLIAREMNLSETAFLSESDKADYRLQWFTPAAEVQLCGHATISAIHILNELNLVKNSAVTFDTLSGILKCGIADGKYYMQIPYFKTEEFSGDKKEILKALGAPESDVDKNIPFILLENGYLYIYVKTYSALQKLNPDFKALKKISADKKEFFDITVFSLETVDKDNFAHLRFFAPYYGIDEDPVTGSANGPLMLVLEKLGFLKDFNLNEEITLTFEQGDIINRKGRVAVSYNPKEKSLRISGSAVTVIKGEIYL